MDSLFIILLSFTNGWFLTLYLMYVCENVEDDEDIETTSTIGVILQLLGMVIGLTSTNFLKRNWTPPALLE